MKQINASEVPPIRHGKSKYKDLFAKIPVGKAIVIDENIGEIVTSFNRFRRRGEFKQYYITQKQGLLYIVNKGEKK